MKKLNIFIVLLLAATQTVTAQKVSGSVFDDNHKPLAYVTTRLLKTDSTFVQGTLTDSLGIFSMNAGQKGKYLLSLSSIGYKPKVVSLDAQHNVQLPAIILETDNVRLQEITVKASSFVRKNDRILIYPDSRQTRHSSTGYDLLYRLMIPEIEVDRLGGKVSTLGGNATLYIDGRKAEAREIMNLNPKDIENIEYFDVPSGKYMNDVASINFITQKRKSGGYVTLDGKQTIGYLDGDYNVSAKIARNNTSYTLFAGHAMTRYDGMEDHAYEHFLFADHETYRQTRTLDSRVKSNSQYAQLNIANQNEKRSLMGKFSLVRNAAPDNYSHSEVIYGDAEKIQESVRNTNQRGTKPGIELFGHFNINDRQFLETTLRGSYSDNSYSYLFRENSYSTQTDSKEDLYEFSALVNYGIRFKHHNSFTVQAYHFQTTTSVDYRGSNPSWQHFWDGESMFFLEYTQKFGSLFSLRFAPGMDYEQYHLHGDKKRDQLSPRLHFNLVCTPSKNQQIRIGCPIGNGYLNINELNAVEQQIDSLQIRRGNPHQKIAFQTTPMISYNGQFGRFNLGADVRYNVMNHIQTEDIYVENGKLIRSYSSEGKPRMFSAQMSAAWKVTDNLRLKLAGTWIYTKLLSTPDELKHLTANMQMDYYWKDFSCGIYIKTKTKSLDFNRMYFTESANYGGYVSWSHKKLHLEGGVKNPFSNSRNELSEMNRNVYNYYNYETGKLYRPSGFVKIAYNFDFGKKTSREDSDVDTSINSSILKAN